jgi:hypothetical protein
MKIESLVIAVSLCAALFAGCAVRKESQFASRLEETRFCQRYLPDVRRC